MAKENRPPPQDLLELYGITPELIANLDFRAGFGLVIAHWYPRIVQAQSTQETSSITEIFPALKGNEFATILRELNKEFAKSETQAKEIREHLKSDPSGLSWLTERMKHEESVHDYLPFEKVGVEKAIAGATALYKRINTLLNQPNQ